MDNHDPCQVAVALSATLAEGLGIVDVRPTAAYAAGHVRGSASFPLEELSIRTAELPPQTGSPIALVADEGDALAEALCFLRGDGAAASAGGKAAKAKGWAVRQVLPASPELWEEARRLGAVEQGELSRRLWSPSTHLPDLVPGLEDALPSDSRRALDLGCGRGRDAIWLASRGWSVVGVDNQPAFLKSMADFAAREGLATRVSPVLRDVRKQPIADLLEQPLALVNVSRFMSRALLDEVVAAMPPGCVLAVHHFGRDAVSLKSGRPIKGGDTDACGLSVGELAARYGEGSGGLEVLLDEEAETAEGRPLCSFAGRKRV